MPDARATAAMPPKTPRKQTKSPTEPSTVADAFEARAEDVLRRVALVKARAEAAVGARAKPIDSTSLDALLGDLSALTVSDGAQAAKQPITRVQTPPPILETKHRRTVSVSAKRTPGVVVKIEDEKPPPVVRVGLLYDEAMERHCKDGHFEQPARHRVVVNEVRADHLDGRCVALESREATDEELLRAHSREHIDFVKNAFKEDGEAVQVMTGENVFGDDIFFTQHTATGARLAAGCVTEACDAVCRGDVDRAFAIVRPPGHHAVCSQAMGFCFFNNTVVAARAAIATHEDVSRVMILDWDVHHGNGIQDITYDDPNIMYVSLHRYGDGFYPGTGAASEVGTSGTNVNVGWKEKGLGDADYLAAFDIVIEPVVKAFSPDLIIIAAGFDAADGDPLGGMMLSTAGYGHMTRRLCEIGSGRVVVALEGGYALRPLATCASATLRALLGDEPKPISSRSRPRKSSIKLCNELAGVLAPHWPVLESDEYKKSVASVAKRATVVGSFREYPTGRRTPRSASSQASTQTTTGVVCTK